MRITVDFSDTRELDADRASWLTHSHRLRALTTLAGFNVSPVGGTPAILVRLAERAEAFPVPNGARGSLADVAGCLNRAWGTELVMCGAKQYAAEDELLRLVNSWAAVQTYYVTYHVCQALLVAEGKARPTTHPATQRQYVDLWIARGARIDPWTFAVGSKQDTRFDAGGMANGPGRELHGISALSACTADTAWELGEGALRTTREAAFVERRRQAVDAVVRTRQKEWSERWGQNTARKKPAWWSSRPRLDAADRAKVEKGTRPYTVIDYLYRLRLKANYEDARMYTEGPASHDETESVNVDLIRLAAATSLVHEVRIAKFIGVKALIREAERWVSRNAPTGMRYGLPVRLPILEQLR